MIELAGYSVTETLYRSPHSIVQRGVTAAGERVILKVLSDPRPAPRNVVRLRHEHRLLSQLDPWDGLPTPIALGDSGNSPLLVTEDISAHSLAKLLQDGPLGLRDGLEIGLQITRTLSHVHEHSVVHKDITPGNVVWNAELRRTQLIDFGIATQVTRELPAEWGRGILEGTLAYISPEQTGRTGRTLDYRTDLYSLGATLFEALTGRPPFKARDFMELIHSHIARQPPLAHEIRPELPRIVSRILDRLLSKSPEDRYQSAYALSVDLERCLAKLESLGRIPPFPLGEKDVSDRFEIPQRLYGREEEIRSLLDVFDRASLGSKELALVAGTAGVGKSALVRELYQPIVERRGYFVSGKCDQLSNVPMGCLLQACRELIRQLLTESEARVASWRERILAALGPNGGVIVEVIPDVELIIGPQPPLPSLPPMESENRFNLTFEKFLRAFTDPEHPLVLFLDDLQWADNPTLRLLQRLMTDQDTRYLLLLGAYRDNEVDGLHPLSLTVDDLREANALVETIVLPPLNHEHVRDLLADTLHCDPAEAEPLADICRTKTEGNPFFLGRFLLDLHERGAFRFDLQRASWTWSLSEIQTMQVASNVVELLATKLHTLPESTQADLRLGACVGNTFELAALSLIRERGQTDIARELWPAVEAGLIMPLGEDHHFVGPGGEDAPLVEGIRYRFLHDRVQQAAYSLIPETERAASHRRIGRILLAHHQGEAQEDRLFEIVEQLNRGPREPASERERDELVDLNLRAGRKAANSAAFQPAMTYLERGIELLGEEGWSRRYPRTLQLHVQAAGAAYRGSRYERSDELVEVVLERAQDPLDKVDAYETRVLALVVQKRQRDAIAAALAFLETRGIKFPQQPGRRHLLLALADTRLALLGKRPEDLAGLPVMTDPAQLAAMRMLVSISSSAYLTRQDLFPLLILRQMSLSARNGVTPHSAYALSTYGIILIGVLGDIDAGVRCGTTALKLLDRLPRVGLECRTRFCHETFLRPWRDHARHAWEALFATYEHGIDTGDVEYAAWSSMTRVMFAYFIGCNLAEVDEEIVRWTSLQQKFRHDAALDYTRIYWQGIQNLRGLSDDPCRLVGDVYDEDARLPHHREQQDGFALCSIHLHKLVLCFLFGDPEGALKAGAIAKRYLDNYLAFPLQTVFYLYDALVRLALCESASRLGRQAHLLEVHRHLRKLRKWCRHAPMNHTHRVALVEAELARVRGDVVEAVEAYERSIRAARENGYINDEALAYELAGRFHRSRGNDVLARAYLGEATYAYERWGAMAKVQQLESLLPRVEPTVQRPSTGSYTGTTRILDVESVVKTSQAISGEIVLERLLERLMILLLENAGAERGLLVLKGPEGPRLVAEATAQGNHVEAGLHQPLEQATRLSPAIVGYVLRTGESLLLRDAVAEGEFVRDPYVQRTRPRSVLCAPVTRTGTLTGAVFLENNLAADAFTPERVELVQLLSSQAAISLENAKLYASVEAATRQLEAVNQNLEARVEERTLELKEMNAELGDALRRLQAMQERIITQEKLASLGALTAGIAHQIKNPLNFVNNFAQLSSELAEELADELEPNIERLPDETSGQIRELLRDLRSNATKINQYGRQADGIVRGMLAHSRGDRGETAPTDLNALLGRHLDLVGTARFGELGFVPEVERDCDDALQPITVNPQSLSQVFLNLIDNACYALAERRALEGEAFAPTLRASTRQDGEWAEIRLRDNGTGIPPEVRARVFSPFFTTKPAGEGVGFGLSVAHDIVTKVHGGDLQVESEPGEFTEFIIRLPRGPAPSNTPLLTKA